MLQRAGAGGRAHIRVEAALWGYAGLYQPYPGNTQRAQCLIMRCLHRPTSSTFFDHFSPVDLIFNSKFVTIIFCTRDVKLRRCDAIQNNWRCGFYREIAQTAVCPFYIHGQGLLPWSCHRLCGATQQTTQASRLTCRGFSSGSMCSSSTRCCC